MMGLAAELSGARLWMKVASATIACEPGFSGRSLKTCSRLKMKYGDQHMMNTGTQTGRGHEVSREGRKVSRRGHRNGLS